MLQLFGFAVLIVAIILSYRYYVRPGIRAYAGSVVAFRIGMYFVGLVTGIVLTARYHANMYSHLVTLSRAEGVGYVLLALAGIGLSLRNGGQFEVPPASQPVPSSATAGVMP